MEELDDVLGLLRAPEGARRAPQPTLAELDRLVADAYATGLGVHLEVGGPLERLPAPVSREGYRIVQEGLTNAARHAGRVPASLRVAVSKGGWTST
jgi:signal transduction histidine kinase